MFEGYTGATTVMKRTNWTEEEEIFLHLIAEAQPLPDLVTRFNRMAARQGWPERTQASIEVKLRRLGICTKSTLDQVSIGTLANTLGINRSRIRRWIVCGLPARMLNPTRRAIALKDLRSFAKLHPQRFYGIEPERLEWIGIDPTSIPSDTPQGVRVPMQRLDTGEIYPSITEAACASYVDLRALQAALRDDRPCAGIQWKRVTVNSEQSPVNSYAQVPKQ